LLTPFASSTAWSANAAQSPNIVLIMADDLGYECLGAYGGTSYNTPNLDKLAASGTRFEHCYSQPLCTPSRVKLMTGISNARNYVRFNVLDWKETTFGNLLKNAGYKTCIAGKWQLKGGLEAPAHFGFDEYCLWQLTHRHERYYNPGFEINGKPVQFNNGEYGPDVVNRYVCDFIGKKHKQPFFAYYPMLLPHAPFLPTPDSADHKPGQIPTPGRKYFKDMVAYIDKLVGNVITKLEQLGIRENTLVIFTGDNGTGSGIVSNFRGGKYRGGKRQTTDNGTRVPLILNQPGTVSAGLVCNDLVDFSDFLPTLCEAAGTPVPDKLKIDGRSFLAQATGRKGNPRQWVYSWHKRKPFARTQRYKLYGNGRFHDLQSDPNEQKPLDLTTLNKETAAVYKQLAAVLDKYKH